MNTISINNHKSRGHALIASIALTIVILLLVNPGSARAQGAGWSAEYYPNTTLSGSPALTRTDSEINFNWGSGSPGGGLPADGFSARWTRTEWFDGGTYRFSARSDDGFRLWVGDLLVIDSWIDQQGGWLTRDMYLGGGNRQVRAEYYENQGAALVQMNWERISGGSGWTAEYYANMNLSGSPAVVRTDNAIDFDWDYGSPDASIPADQFSVRWTRTLGFAAGTYRFYSSSDDGIRLWVDGQLLVDVWYHQGLPNTHYGDLALGDGLHQVKVEYFEDGGQASAHVWWQQVGVSYQGWKGEYYANLNLAGGPTLIRDDAQINFDWSTESPVDWMPDDNFSVRWTRQVSFPPGYYRLSARSDDGVRVWLDDNLVIDKWQVMNNELHYVDGIYISGLHALKVEYFEMNGYARIQFWIDAAGVPLASPPTAAGTIIVDDGGPGFMSGGVPSSWRIATTGVGGRYSWTFNNDYGRSNYNWARWYPELAAGQYEVFAYIPAQHATTRHARYWIKHDGYYSLRVVNQSIYYGEWVSLGTFYFNGGGEEYISLSDITYEAYLSRSLAFDAVKWVLR